MAVDSGPARAATAGALTSLGNGKCLDVTGAAITPGNNVAYLTNCP
ncbi:hypothetical protein [Streptomyces sp. HF10]|nr:hypothetical protein [Streptomyces sp. HF10]